MDRKIIMMNDCINKDRKRGRVEERGINHGWHDRVPFPRHRLFPSINLALFSSVTSVLYPRPHNGLLCKPEEPARRTSSLPTLTDSLTGKWFVSGSTPPICDVPRGGLLSLRCLNFIYYLIFGIRPDSEIGWWRSSMPQTPRCNLWAVLCRPGLSPTQQRWAIRPRNRLMPEHSPIKFILNEN